MRDEKDNQIIKDQIKIFQVQSQNSIGILKVS